MISKNISMPLKEMVKDVVKNKRDSLGNRNRPYTSLGPHLLYNKGMGVRAQSTKRPIKMPIIEKETEVLKTEPQGDKDSEVNIMMPDLNARPPKRTVVDKIVD
jgi:hypothetical protein